MSKATVQQKALLCLLGGVCALILVLSPVVRVPLLDAGTERYFRDAITKAGVAYATCRAINGAVSVIKESQLQLEPAGIGVSLAAGQVLDPIDDMTERLSDVLVTAITSLGVQELSYQIGVSLAPAILAGLLVIMSILVWFDNSRSALLQRTVRRLLTIMLILRFCLPLSAVVNQFLYHHYFGDEISRANQQLDLRLADSQSFSDITLPDSPGFWSALGNSTVVLKNISVDLKKSLVGFVTNMKEIVDNLLKLTFLYVGIFLIQVILLPISVFWLLIYLATTFSSS